MTITELRDKIIDYRTKGLTYKDMSNETGYSLTQSYKFTKIPDYRPPQAYLFRLQNMCRRIDEGELIITRGIANNAMESYPPSQQHHAKLYHKLYAFACTIDADVRPIPFYKSPDKTAADLLFAEHKIKKKLLEITKEERFHYNVRFNDSVGLINWLYLAIKIRNDYADKHNLPRKELWSGEKIWRETYGKLHEAIGQEIAAKEEEDYDVRSSKVVNRRTDMLNLL